MKFNYKLLTACLFIIFYSCSNEEDDNIINNTSNEVRFTSEINNRSLETRAYNAFWESGDKIGVFMKASGSILSNQSVIDGSSNKTYGTTGNGAFSPFTSDQAINFPSNNSTVDFIAYYPYQSNINDYIYKVNVTQQNTPQNIDLLYSDNLKEINSASPSKTLTFTHQLSKVNFNIKVSDNISNINNLSVSVSGVKTLADFNLSDGSLSVDASSEAMVTFKTTITNNTAFVEAILLPDNGGTNRVVTFKLSSVATFKWTIPNDTKLEKGGKYTYNITLDASGIDVTPTFGWTETPKKSPLADNLIYITHMMGDNKTRNYSMLYDTKYKLAYWVAYPLHSYYLGDQSRTNKWAYDPYVVNSFQPNLSNSYTESNLDRGHQIPSGDRTKDYASNAQTFYYTNMTAQEGTRFNQTIWATLEDQVRTWTSRCDTMYVVTGAMITTTTDSNIEYAHDKDNKAIAKPKYHYKALAQKVGNVYYTIAFKMDNKPYNSGDSFNNYRITVKQLEQETGYSFFPSIPEDSKSQINLSRWN